MSGRRTGASVRRWIAHIFIGLLGLILLAMAVVQVLLWTNLPKNLLVAQLEAQLGLRINAQSLSTGWLGHTTLKNGSLGLPLEEQTFLTVPTLRLKHTTLFGLLIGRSFAIDSIEIDQPTMVAVQGADGQWNIQGAVQTAALLAGGQSAATAGPQRIPVLPKLKLVDGTIEVIDNQQRWGTIGPLNAVGASVGSLVWRCSATIGDAVRLDAEVAPGGAWKHRVKFVARQLDATAGNLGIATYQADFNGTWAGQIDDGKFIGRLTLDHLAAQNVPGLADVTLDGTTDVEADGSTLTLRPQSVELKSSILAFPPIRLTAGAFTHDDSGLHAHDVQVGVLGGLAILNGSLDRKRMSADFQARWTGLELPGRISNRGSLTATLRMPFAGHPAVALVLDSQGSTARGSWDATVQLAGTGQSWKSIDWVLTAPKLDFDGSVPIHLSQLSGHITQRYPMVELTDLSLPGSARLNSQGNFDLEKYSWYFWLDGGAPTSAWGKPISLWINTWGDAQLYTLKEMDLRVGNLGLWAGGYYDSRIPKPLNLNAVCQQIAQPTAAARLQGHVGANFTLTGLLLDNQIAGDFTSTNLVAFNRPVGDVDLKFDGEIAWPQAQVQTQELSLFGGRWHFNARHTEKNDGLKVAISVRDLPLAEVAKFAHVAGVTGNVTSGDCNLTATSFDTNRIDVDHSQIVIHDLAVGMLTMDEVKIEPGASAGDLHRSNRGDQRLGPMRGDANG